MTETNKIFPNSVETIDIKAEVAIDKNKKPQTTVNQGYQTTKSATKILPTNTEKKTPVNHQENVDWFAASRKLRQDNRQILKNLVEKEEELAIVTEQLQAQITKTQSIDILAKQQAEELNIAQEQVNRLIQELENAQEIINKKQKEIEILASELKGSQQQIAHLERQCSNLQDEAEKEQQKSIYLEQQLKESEFRLKREQRHNLQFKAALNQCLETPGYVSPINISSEEQKTSPIISPNSRIPKNEGIKPWSDVLEELENFPAETGENREQITAEKEHFIPQLQVLNQEIPPVIKEQQNSPSPLLNRGNYQSKTKKKRELSLPKFSRLQLNDSV